MQSSCWGGGGGGWAQSKKNLDPVTLPVRAFSGKITPSEMGPNSK